MWVVWKTSCDGPIEEGVDKSAGRFVSCVRVQAVNVAMADVQQDIEDMVADPSGSEARDTQDRRYVKLSRKMKHDATSNWDIRRV